MDIRRWDLCMYSSSHRSSRLMPSPLDRFFANTDSPTVPPTNKRPLDPVESEISEVDLEPDEVADAATYNELLKRMRALEAENERIRIDTTVHTMLLTSMHSTSGPEFHGTSSDPDDNVRDLRERLDAIHMLTAPDMRTPSITEEEGNRGMPPHWVRALEADNERLRLEGSGSNERYKAVFDSLHALSGPECWMSEAVDQLRDRLLDINLTTAPDRRGLMPTEEVVAQ